MDEHELELRLRAAAGTLDERAPSFDMSRLPAARARRIPRGIVIACIALAAVAAAPIAVSAIRGLFEVDEVPALGPLEYGVAPPLAGRSVPISTAQASTPWRIHMLPSLGEPNEARVRDDITGGMVTLVYRSIALTQWRRLRRQRAHRARAHRREGGGGRRRGSESTMGGGHRPRDLHAHRSGRNRPPRELRRRSRAFSSGGTRA